MQKASKSRKKNKKTNERKKERKNERKVNQIIEPKISKQEQYQAVLEYLQNNPGTSQRNACTALGVGRQSFRRWKKNGGPPIDTVGDGRGIFTKEQER